MEIIKSDMLKEKIETKYMTNEIRKIAATTDYLTLPEISKRVIKQVRPDLLYRTHVVIHTLSKTDSSKKLVKAHKLVADELTTRGFIHHQWDKLDTLYQH